MPTREEIAAQVAKEFGVGSTKDATEWSRIFWDALIDAKVSEQSLVQPLKDICDRDWKDETPAQIVAIASNAIYWRDQEIAKLRDAKVELAEREQRKSKSVDEVVRAMSKAWRDYGTPTMGQCAKIARDAVESYSHTVADSSLRVKELSEALRTTVSSLSEFSEIRQSMLDVGGAEGPLDQGLIHALAEMQVGIVDRAENALAGARAVLSEG